MTGETIKAVMLLAALVLFVVVVCMNVSIWRITRRTKRIMAETDQIMAGNAEALVEVRERLARVDRLQRIHRLLG